MSLAIRPTGIDLHPDARRVLVRPFLTSDATAVRHIVARALALSPAEVAAQLAHLRVEFAERHVDLEERWRHIYELVRPHVAAGHPVDEDLRLYLGALGAGEYAIESAALFNPSIVPHPDQTGVPAGALRFILSLRATGEGHISSIEFRSGLIAADGTVTVDPVSRFVTAPGVKENPTYRRSIFQDKLREMGFENDWSWSVINALGADFTRRDLDAAIARASAAQDTLPRESQRTMDCIDWLAHSNYEVHFPPTTTLTERIIFPVSPNETNGIEDARFVRFVDDDGAATYYATYTAYNGHAILPQFIETPDFASFAVCTLNGQAAQNKGMALFPRRIGDRYVMISRQDDENLFLMTSDNLHFWNNPQLLRRPTRPWEFVKIGNCGSPLETPEGWILITHGVGPMRRYCLGALLLDLEDPSQVIGWLEEPLIEPTGDARDGYVPNVVYSCGALLHGGRIVLPHAVSDTSSTIVTLTLTDLLDAFTCGS